MKLVLASKNQKKLVEMNEILSHLGIQVCSEAEAGVDVEVEETGTTFEENSLLKARAVMEASGMPAIADDSGLCVDALNGAPGVYSARYGGEGLDDTGRYRLLLENMRGQTPRTAKFVSVITCCFPNGDDPADGQVRVRHHLLLPQRGRALRPGGVPRHHRLCPHGGGRLRVRPGVLHPQPEKDLRPALSRGEERHLPPGQGSGGFPGQAGGVPRGR